MPTLAELDHAMSRPGRYVPAVKQLGGGTVIARGEGQPFRIAGNDAVVYKLENPGFGAIALRCFLDDQIPDRTIDIYRGLSHSATHRRFLAEEYSPLVERLAFFTEGVVLRSRDLRSFSVPVVAMEWLQGPTLFLAADHACRTGNSEALTSLAKGWRAAVEAMGEAQFVHGSLSPDNAMVDLNRGIVLVDYDHAWWPGLSAPPREHVLAHYHHRRGEGAAPERRDDFAALTIYVSLRMLAARPALRQRYGQPAAVRDGSLLFSQRDLDAPNRSELFRELAHINEVESRALAGYFLEAARAPAGQAPSIGDAVLASSSARKRTVPRVMPELRHVPEIPRAKVPDDSLHTASVENSATVTAEMRRQLEDALFVGDAGAAVKLWPVMAGDDASSHLAISTNALIQRFVRAGIDEALTEGSPQAIIEAVAASRRLGVPVSTRAVRASRQAKLSMNLRDQVERAVAADDRAQLADFGTIAAALPLNKNDDPLRSNMTLAMHLRLLEEALKGDDDQRILRSVTSELWSAPDYLPPVVLERVQLARSRMRWKEEVRRAMKQRDGHTLGALMELQPPGAAGKLTETERKRADRLIAQTKALERLQDAMLTRGDRELVDAMNDVEAAGALLPPELNWAGIRDVVDRLSLVASIRRAALSEPRDYLRLGRLLPAAREAFGGSTPYLGSKLDADELERDVQRDTQRRRLLEAIATGDEIAIGHAASPDPYGVVPALPAAERQVVERVLDRLQKVDPLRPMEPRSNP